MMAKNVNKTRQNVEGSSREDQFVVLLENMRDEIKLVAEGNLMLQERMDAGFKEVRGDIEAIKDDLIIVKIGLHEVKHDLNSVRQDLNSTREEMHAGFKGLIAESAKNDEVLAQKVDKKELIFLEKRVAKLEIAK